jgi:hypothetical protein
MVLWCGENAKGGIRLEREGNPPQVCCANISGVKHLAIAWALLRFYSRITPANWYRHPPFLPVPPRDYLAWRFHTAYGNIRPPASTVVRDIWQLGDWLRTFPE